MRKLGSETPTSEVVSSAREIHESRLSAVYTPIGMPTARPISAAIMASSSVAGMRSRIMRLTGSAVR